MSKNFTGTNGTRFGRDAIGLVRDLYRDLAWLLLLGSGLLGTALLLLFIFLQIEESIVVAFVEGAGR